MILNDKERKNYNTIEKVINGIISRKEASIELKLSLRQIDRLRVIYYAEGENGFAHKNRGRDSQNKKDNRIIEELEEIYLSEYFDYNFEQFYEEINDKYAISYDVMLKRFTKDDIISPLAHRKTVKEYKEKMNSVNKSNENVVDNNKIELYKSRIIEAEKAHTRRSSNLYVFGQEIQMDACGKLWFGDIPSYLHLAVDKATKKVLFGWFEFEEITRGYYVLLFHIIINYGIPTKIKADNRSSFSANNTKYEDKKVFFTQFGKICEELNIVLETTSIPTSKANVERENGTFKNRLIAELRHENITTIDEANNYLNNVFILKMNKKFSYAIDNSTSLMRENNYTEDELKLVISEKNNRIIDNASSISYNKRYYVPFDLETGEIINFMKGTKCILIINYDGDYYSEIENHYYKMIELENRNLTMKKESEINIYKKESEINIYKKEHHKYIPPKNHPWRKNMMLNH